MAKIPITEQRHNEIMAALNKLLAQTAPVVAPVLPVINPPAWPHAFYGTVGGATNGQLRASGTGVRVNIPGNPVALTNGAFGSATWADAGRLLVQGTIAPGTPLMFFLDDRPLQIQAASGTQRTIAFEPGAITNLVLIS